MARFRNTSKPVLVFTHLGKRQLKPILVIFQYIDLSPAVCPRGGARARGDVNGQASRRGRHWPPVVGRPVGRPTADLQLGLMKRGRPAWCDLLKYSAECGTCRSCRKRHSMRRTRERQLGKFVHFKPHGRRVEPCDVAELVEQRRDWRISRQLYKQKRPKVVRGSASPRRLTTTFAATAVEVRSAGRMGRGLYASCPIKTGDHLCAYEGRYYGSLVSLEKSRKARGLPESTAALKIMDGTNRYIDGDDPAYMTTPGRAANHSSLKPNAKYEEVQGACVLVALQDIAADQQVFIDYGPDYVPVRELRSRSIFH